MFKQSTLKFNGMYRGKVLDNLDPDELGRLKIQVLGVFDEIESEDIPWAIPAYPIFSGSGDGYGYFAIPEIDSFVWVFFEVGNIYQPVYFAEAPSAIHGIPSEAATNYPYTKVIKTKNGIVFYIDDLTQDIKLTQPSGTSLQISPDGSVTIVSAKIVTITGTSVRINP